MRTCSKCGEQKPLEEYYLSRGRPYGHCKACDKIRVQAWDRQNREKVVATSMRKRERKPEQFRARAKVAYALKTGRLVKPETCEDCGATNVKIYGHHEDYNKPLDVNWVCSKCHAKRHANDYQNRGRSDD